LAAKNMLYWDIIWSSNKDKLEKLPSYKSRDFLISAISEAVTVLGGQWRTNLKRSARKQLDVCLEACLENHQIDSLVLNKFETLVEDTDYPGFYDIGNALLIVLRNNHGDFNLDQMYETLSYAYQSILSVEIIAKLERHTLEDEVAKMEENNPICISMINSQLRLLDQYTKEK
jgi:hypothetical protein